jgi:hypothetical protein
MDGPHARARMEARCHELHLRPRPHLWPSRADSCTRECHGRRRAVYLYHLQYLSTLNSSKEVIALNYDLPRCCMRDVWSSRPCTHLW